ncbi:MAG: tripartite tricarboxylate transporter TctB family protein [Pseudomonadota bacterium]
MRRLEFFVSLLLVLFSLLVCREAYRLSLGRPAVPGAGLFPFLLGGILLGLSLLYFFRSWNDWRRKQEIHLWEGLRWEKVLLVLGALFAYGLLLEKVGFLFCTFLLLMSLFRWVDRQRWYWVYGGALGISILCHVVFKIWLKIQLPVGFLRIL